MPKHIVRLIALLAGCLVLGLTAKWYFTAPSFYEYGHYRADSVPEIAAQQAAFQGAGYCQSCHTERHAQWSANNHKSVTCEVCHGAAQGHPQKGKLPIPADARKLCTLCHEKLAERPRTQPPPPWSPAMPRRAAASTRKAAPAATARTASARTTPGRISPARTPPIWRASSAPTSPARRPT